MIFTNVELRDKEEDHLEAFRKFCKEKGQDIPEGYDDENRFVLRVLQGKKWKYEVAIEEIITHSEWKKATYPLKYDPVKDMLSQGIIYAHKRDLKHRPIVIVDCEKILKMADQIDLLVSATNFFLDHVISKAMVPGKIENWTTIFDLRSVGATQMSNKNIQQVVKAM
mmetsp:Transcript_11069/g.18523  ORF Transcript_11069/g.18523 Transcript_11069/m.18523 type:complete len:167 (+) Transcript_11069:146-646(+)